jgi:bifunctional N-acetylglucosamine-1-phosphate-uridyltransferase/glucosamine-1-phosphate-acetyltransferase GlmU-like protein
MSGSPNLVMTMSKIEIARLLNVKVNTDTGQVFLEMEVTDPAWKQRILREWQDMDVKLVIEKKEGSPSEKEEMGAIKEIRSSIKRIELNLTRRFK